MNWKRKSISAVTSTTEPAKSFNDVSLIKRYEGLALKAYLPTPNDKWTVGYGHTKTAHRGMVITEDQAEDLLRSDLSWVEDCIRRLVKVPLTNNQYDAVGSLIFNIGEGNFSKSTVLKKLNLLDYRGAADAFLMWNKQRNKATGQLQVLNGLTRRREEERKLFLS